MTLFDLPRDLPSIDRPLTGAALIPPVSAGASKEVPHVTLTGHTSTLSDDHSLDDCNSPAPSDSGCGALPRFGGSTYDPAQDGERLTGQLARVYAVVKDAQWRTLAEIGALADAPEASVSARLRDLRKPEFGGHRVERERVGPGRGLWQYRVIVREESHG